MSCMMASLEALSALSDALESVLNLGYSYHGFEAPASLRKALEGCMVRGEMKAEKIFGKLYEMNRKAYDGRYEQPNEEAVEIPKKPDFRRLLSYCTTTRVQGGRGYFYNIRAGHYQLLSLLDFYIYQCEEEATRNAPLLLALQEFAVVLSGFIARNAPAYAVLPWGKIEG